MPKLSKSGENTKAVEAKLRKSSALKAEQEKKLKAEEDASWHDDDKLNAKKQNRKVRYNFIINIHCAIALSLFCIRLTALRIMHYTLNIKRKLSPYKYIDMLRQKYLCIFRIYMLLCACTFHVNRLGLYIFTKNSYLPEQIYSMYNVYVERIIFNIILLQEDKEKKRLEVLARKTTNKLLAEEEVSSIVVAKSQPATKVTQAQITVSLNVYLQRNIST